MQKTTKQKDADKFLDSTLDWAQIKKIIAQINNFMYSEVPILKDANFKVKIANLYGSLYKTF